MAARSLPPGDGRTMVAVGPEGGATAPPHRSHTWEGHMSARGWPSGFSRAKAEMPIARTQAASWPRGRSPQPRSEGSSLFHGHWPGGQGSASWERVPDLEGGWGGGGVGGSQGQLDSGDRRPGRGRPWSGPGPTGRGSPSGAPADPQPASGPPRGADPRGGPHTGQDRGPG